MRNPLMWKLLRKHISKAQLIGFAIANMVGLTIVLLGLQFWQDVRPVFEDEDSFIRKDYLVVTKSIGTASMVKSMLGGTDANAFSESEIADLERQPWMRKVGRFSTTNYKVMGNLGISGRSVSLHTYIFFESVPDEFIDTKNIKWGFDAQQPAPGGAHPAVERLSVALQLRICGVARHAAAERGHGGQGAYHACRHRDRRSSGIHRGTHRGILKPAEHDYRA